MKLDDFDRGLITGILSTIVILVLFLSCKFLFDYVRQTDNETIEITYYHPQKQFDCHKIQKIIENASNENWTRKRYMFDTYKFEFYGEYILDDNERNEQEKTTLFPEIIMINSNEK